MLPATYDAWLKRAEGLSGNFREPVSLSPKSGFALLCVPKIGFGVDAGNKRGKLAA